MKATHLQPLEPEASGTLVQTTVESLVGLRLPADYGAGLGVKKLLSHVRVGKPNRTTFFRARRCDEWQFRAGIYQHDRDEFYIVNASVQESVEGAPFRYVTLHAAVNRGGDVFLIPVTLPAEDGRRNAWHESLDQAVVQSESRWVKVAANMANGAYDVYEAQGKLADPEWPDVTMDQLVEVAFRGRVIRELDHPVIQALQGRL